MALVDKHVDSNLAMVRVVLQGLSIDKLRQVLRFAESLIIVESPGTMSKVSGRTHKTELSAGRSPMMTDARHIYQVPIV